ncbi:MAG: O-methyltransferase [Anaerolineales bacterium]|nr:O-methyltransferase [Anaerolineales bacterium]MCX7609060.1 O-methyltransferase [Anaerolineales bacterium]MDW8227135.1 O-methyltransferase [Anaerolineales bacterium]
MDVSLLPDYLNQYLESLVPPRPPELQAMEEYARQHRFPIIGPVCGYFCYQITRLMNARRVFELGSGFGYSTAWFAQGVQENGGGEVWHVVWDANLSQQARLHLERLGVSEVVRYVIGEAVTTLRETPGLFDLIFLDIDKEDYPAALEVIVTKLRPGGLLIADNMLWSGRIFDPADRSDSTRGIQTLTRLLTHDPRWKTTLLPLRDGLILAFRDERRIA